MVRKRGRNRHNWATSAKTLPGARVLSCPRRCETLAWYNAKKPGDLGVFQAVCFKPKLEEVSAGHQTRHGSVFRFLPGYAAVARAETKIENVEPCQKPVVGRKKI